METDRSFIQSSTLFIWRYDMNLIKTTIDLNDFKVNTFFYDIAFQSSGLS